MTFDPIVFSPNPVTFLRQNRDANPETALTKRSDPKGSVKNAIFGNLIHHRRIKFKGAIK